MNALRCARGWTIVASIVIACTFAALAEGRPAATSIRFLRLGAPNPAIAGRLSRYQSLVILTADGQPVRSGVKVSCMWYFTRGWTNVQYSKKTAGTWTAGQGDSPIGTIRCSLRVPKSAKGLWLSVIPHVAYGGIEAAGAKSVRGPLGRAKISAP